VSRLESRLLLLLLLLWCLDTVKVVVVPGTRVPSRVPASAAAAAATLVVFGHDEGSGPGTRDVSHLELGDGGGG